MSWPWAWKSTAWKSGAWKDGTWGTTTVVDSMDGTRRHAVTVFHHNLIRDDREVIELVTIILGSGILEDG